MTQGDPLSPTILNVVVDAVLCHWVMVVEEEDSGPYGFSRAVQNMAALFYTKNGLLASTRAERLQQVFDALMYFFYRLGMRNNIINTVGMICHTYRSPGGHSAEAYDQRMTGEGQAYKALLKRRVHCRKCVAELATGSLVAHC